MKLGDVPSLAEYQTLSDRDQYDVTITDLTTAMISLMLNEVGENGEYFKLATGVNGNIPELP